MCGITGLIHLDGEPVSPIVLKRMTDAIAHRGPDGEGHWIKANVGLGHRRLAIIDLSPAGHQPMASISQRFLLVYNGEIYNFRELRIELEALGHQFRSRTDSEVVLNAFVAWGIEALNRFNGMFALALWDQHEKTLILARDRYGIKPLYFAIQGETIAFGSEQKAILAIPNFPKDIDREALLEYFTFQNIFTEKTLVKAIQLLPPGSYVKIGTSKKTPSIESHNYWDYNFIDPEKKITASEYREELDLLFRQAVKRQLVTDVELGSYLSGGMDSGSITAIASREIPYLKTFTCGFDLNSASGIELAFDERSKAEYMSYRFKTEHYEMVLKAGDMERIMPKLAWHIEEPRVGQSYPNFYAAQLTSKFVKVVLSGTGGDEMFGGYPWRYYRAVVNDNFEQYIDKYYQFWQRLVPNSQLRQIFSPIWEDVKHVWTRDIFRDVFKHHANDLCTPTDYINHSLYFEAKTFMQGLLIVEDKLSMAHGLESRVPFLDNDLVDFAMRCPIELKLNNLEKVTRQDENHVGDKQENYFSKTKDGKQILRDVMSSYIPSEITKATKQGFSAPDASWFRGESIDFIKNSLSKNSRIYNFMDHAEVTSQLDRHFTGKENKRLFIWSLISFHHYLEALH